MGEFKFQNILREREGESGLVPSHNLDLFSSKSLCKVLCRTRKELTTNPLLFGEVGSYLSRFTFLFYPGGLEPFTFQCFEKLRNAISLYSSKVVKIKE